MEANLNDLTAQNLFCVFKKMQAKEISRFPSDSEMSSYLTVVQSLSVSNWELGISGSHLDMYFKFKDDSILVLFAEGDGDYLVSAKFYEPHTFVV